MNIKQLAYIIAISDEENISHAAEKLFISRPALNHYLIDLEEEIGLLLFNRINRRMIPTYAGKIYIDGAKRIVDIQKQTYKMLQDIMDSKIGCLNLGITQGQGNILFSKLFPVFHKKFPDFTVNLLEGNVSEVENAVLEGRIDLAIMGWGAIPSSLQHITFVTTEVLLILPKDHPLAYLAAPKGQPYNTIDINLMKNEKFIFRTSNTKSQMMINKYLEEHDFSPQKIMECRLGQMVYNMVKSGVGVAFLNELEIDSGDELPKFSLDPRQFWNFSIAYRKDTKFTQAENYFINLIKRYYSIT